jgi:multiple sugar transport system substrate-binding protein
MGRDRPNAGPLLFGSAPGVVFRMLLELLLVLILLVLPTALTIALPASAATAAAGGRSGGAKLNVIYMAQAGYQPEQFQQMTREFMSRYGIEVAANIVRYDEEYQKIVTSATSTVATYDVVLVDLIWVAEFAEKNYLVPLGKPLLSQLDLDVSPAIKRAFEYKGRVWAMPFLANIHFLFYNQDMLRRAGFSDPPTTIEEMETQMRAIKSRGITKYPFMASWNQKEGLVCEYVWLLGAYGGELFGPDGAVLFNRGPGVQALETMVRWVRDGLANPLSLTADELLVRDVFIDGKAAFAPNWTFLDSIMNDPTVSKVAGRSGIALLPVSADTRNRTGQISSSVSGFQGLAVMANSLRKQEAWQYVEFMTGPDMQKRFLQEVPIWTSLQISPELRQDDPSLGLKAEQMNWLHHRPKLARYHEVSAILQRSIHSALEGSVLPQQALDTAAERIRSLL